MLRVKLRKDLPTKSARATLLQRGSAHCGVTAGDHIVEPSEFDREKPTKLSEERGTTSIASSKLQRLNRSHSEWHQGC